MGTRASIKPNFTRYIIARVDITPKFTVKRYVDHISFNVLYLLNELMYELTLFT